MMRFTRLLFLLATAGMFSTLSAQQTQSLKIGPEAYHVTRKRAGGVTQNGTALGVRLNYDRIKRQSLYWGGQVFYGAGPLKGDVKEDKIHSRLKDFQIEGCLGYTLQTKCYPKFSFTPFGGYGYFRETNTFRPPSFLCVKFVTDYSYIAYGFLSSAQLHTDFLLGLNLRLRQPWQPRCHVSNDPERKNTCQQIEEELSYRIELPMVYKGKLFCNLFETGITPFYELRRYGGRENFPFDFYETKLEIYGINFQLVYRF